MPVAVLRAINYPSNQNNFSEQENKNPLRYRPHKRLSVLRMTRVIILTTESNQMAHKKTAKELQ